MFPVQASLGSYRVATEAPSTLNVIGRNSHSRQLNNINLTLCITYIRDVFFVRPNEFQPYGS